MAINKIKFDWKNIDYKESREIINGELHIIAKPRCQCGNLINKINEIIDYLNLLNEPRQPITIMNKGG